MTTQQKIEKKGYKVVHNIGYRNGQQTIVSVSIRKDNGQFADGRTMTYPNVTKAYEAIK